MVGKATKVYRWTYREDGFVFEYDTAQELAKLMFENLPEVTNPYEPGFTEFDDFNETIWALKRRKESAPPNDTHPSRHDSL